MDSKHIVAIAAVIAVAAVVLSGISLGVALTKENGNGLNDMKYTVFVGTDCDTLPDAEKTMIEILELSDKNFKNGYTAFVATGGIDEEQGIVKNKYSVVLIYGMVTDENALHDFVDILKVEYPTSAILMEKSNAAYDLYLPASDVVYG